MTSTTDEIMEKARILEHAYPESGSVIEMASKDDKGAALVNTLYGVIRLRMWQYVSGD